MERTWKYYMDKYLGERNFCIYAMTCEKYVLLSAFVYNIKYNLF